MRRARLDFPGPHVCALSILVAAAGLTPFAHARNPDLSHDSVNVSGTEAPTDTAVTDSRPQIIVDGSTVHALWRNMSPQSVYTLYYARSLDGGLTFEARRALDPDIAGSADYHATFAVDGGQVHVAAIRKTANQLVYYRSTDGGGSFEPAKVIASNPQALRLSASGGHVSIAFKVSSTLQVASSPDQGANFTTKTVPTTGEPVHSLADLVQDGEHLYLLYLADDNAPYLSHTWLYFVASHDGGETFPTKHLLTKPATDGLTYSSYAMDELYASSAPNLAVDGANVHVVWTQRDEPGSGSPFFLYYNRSTDRGSTFGSPANLDAGTVPSGWSVLPGHETVAARGNRVYVAYAEKSYDSSLFVRSSINGGATFAAPVQVTAAPSAPYGGKATVPLLRIDPPDATGASAHLFWGCANYVRTRDSGATFSYPVLLGPVFSWATCGYSHMAADDTGVLHVLLQGTSYAYNQGPGWGLNDTDIFHLRHDPEPAPVGESSALSLAADPSEDRWDGIVIPGGPDLAFSNAMTLEAWIRPNLPAGT